MDERLTTIKGIGPGREKQLHKLGITNVTSLLTYFPRTYEDRRTIYRIGDLKSGMTGGIVGTVIAVQEKRPRPRLSILEVVIADGTGPLKIVLFNQGYKKNFYKKGQRIYAYGKAEFQYGSMQMNTPQMENLGDGGEPDLHAAAELKTARRLLRDSGPERTKRIRRSGSCGAEPAADRPGQLYG